MLSTHGHFLDIIFQDLSSPSLEDFRAAGLETQIHDNSLMSFSNPYPEPQKPAFFHSKNPTAVQNSKRICCNPNLQHHRIQVHLRFPVLTKTRTEMGQNQIPRNLDGPHQNRLNYTKISPCLMYVIPMPPGQRLHQWFVQAHRPPGVVHAAPDPWAPGSLRHQHSSRQ